MVAELGKGGMRPLMRSEGALVAAETNKEIAEMKTIEHMNQSPFSIDSPDSITSRLAMTLTPYVAAPTSTVNYQNLTSLAMSPLNIVGSAVNKMFSGKAIAQSSTGGFGGEYCADEDLRQMNILTDAYCNPVYGELASVVEDPDYEPNPVFNYMLDNNHVEEDGTVKSDEFKKYRDSCVDTTVPLSPDGGAEDVTDGSIDTRICNKPDKQTKMFETFVAYVDMMDAHDASAQGKLGQREGGVVNTETAGSTLSVSACQGSLPAGDSIKPLCEALKYDAYGYEWGGGHGSTAEQFVRKFKSGSFTPGVSRILDCSGLVRITIYEAFGTDIGGGNVASTMPRTDIFQKIPISEARPGDFVTQHDLKHVAIVMANHTDSNKFDIFHARSPRNQFTDQISQSTTSYSSVNAAYRYIGAKHDQ